MERDKVAVIAVPLPAQGHLNQMLHLSCFISSYGLPVSYVSTPVHIKQVKLRANSLTPQDMARIKFHEIVTPPFPSPPPNPNSPNKFPSQLQPAWNAAMQLRRPLAELIHDTAEKFERVVVVYDPMMAAAVVEDAATITNAESYAFVSISAFSALSYVYVGKDEPFPVLHPTELPPFEDWISDDFTRFLALQASAPSDLRAGDIYNTSRTIEAPYLEILETQKENLTKMSWAVGPLLPTATNEPCCGHRCLKWLDEQNPKSVIYISFGTTVSMSDDQINELARGLLQSKVRFLWILRDADKGDVFEGEAREWAPQPQILAHRSIGGFMSHCGWNSCLESINMGVAMAAWPMHSDQPRNAAFLRDVTKISILVREWRDRREVVKASCIESVVRRLMASREGDEMRKRAEDLGATVRRAARPGGVSRLEMDSFISHISR